MVITANPPKFDKRQPSRGDYDAIVYIDGSQVIAEDSNGRKIASGVAGTDDDVVRDTVYAYVKMSGGGLIRFENNHIWSTPLVVDSSGISLDFSDNCLITLITDTKAIVFNASAANITRSHVKNFHVVVSSDHTQPVVSFESSNAKHIRYCNIDADIDDMHGTTTYTAFQMHSDGGNCCLNDVKINAYTCGTGILLYTTNSGYNNGNKFSGVISGFVTAVDWQNDGGNGSMHNGFYGLRLQTWNYCKDGFKNIENRNVFIDCKFWDWSNATAPNYQYSIPATSFNVVIFSTYLSVWDAQDRTTIQNLGTNTLIINPHTNGYGYKKAVVVSDDNNDVNANFATLSDALASISDASATNRYIILCFGHLYESAVIKFKSFVDVYGNNCVIDSIVDQTYAVIGGETTTNSTIKDLYIRSTSDYVLQVNTSMTEPIIFENCTFENVSSSDNKQAALIGPSNALFKRCNFYAGSGNTCHGVVFNSGDISQLYDCQARGSIAGTGDAWNILCSGRPSLTRCFGRTGKGASGPSYVFNIGYNSSPKLTHCFNELYTDYNTFIYDVNNNGRFRPYETSPYTVIGVQVVVNVAHPGGTLSIGSTIGGDDVVNAISIATTGSKYIAYSIVNIPSGGYLYVTPSIPCNNNDFIIRYVSVIDYSHNTPLNIDTIGFAKVSHCNFTSNGGSDSCLISTTAKKYLLSSCLFETLDVNGYAINASSLISGNCIRKCEFIGNINNIIAIDGKSSGSSTGTGSEQAIPHGLAAIPTGCKAWIKIEYPVGSGRYITKDIPYDVTYVYPTVDNGVAFEWGIA